MCLPSCAPRGLCRARTHNPRWDAHMSRIMLRAAHRLRQQAGTRREDGTRHTVHTASARNVHGEMRRREAADIARETKGRPLPKPTPPRCYRAPEPQTFIGSCHLWVTPLQLDRTTWGEALPSAAYEPTTQGLHGPPAPGSTLLRRHHGPFGPARQSCAAAKGPVRGPMPTVPYSRGSFFLWGAQPDCRTVQSRSA